MRTEPSYRRNIAAILLLLYAFAASPVQFWHTHAGTEHSARTAMASPTEKNTPESLAITKATIAADKCSICSHQHAVFTWDEQGTAVVIEPFRNPIISSLTEPLLQTAHFLFSNKSPPAMA